MATVDQPVCRRELAALANVSTEILRQWETRGLIPVGRRVSGRCTEFEPADALVVLAVAKARGH